MYRAWKEEVVQMKTIFWYVPCKIANSKNILLRQIIEPGDSTYIIKILNEREISEKLADIIISDNALEALQKQKSISKTFFLEDNCFIQKYLKCTLIFYF